MRKIHLSFVEICDLCKKEIPTKQKYEFTVDRSDYAIEYPRPFWSGTRLDVYDVCQECMEAVQDKWWDLHRELHKRAHGWYPDGTK